MPRTQLQNLTEPMYYVLLSLTEPRYGYEIMQEIGEQTGGRVKVGAGTLYALLGRFEEEGIIRQVEIVDRKKIYQLTGEGLEVLKEEYRRLKLLVADGGKVLEKTGNNLPGEGERMVLEKGGGIDHGRGTEKNTDTMSLD